MRIFIYDNNLQDREYLCEMITALPLNCSVDKIFDYSQGVDFYSKYNYDIVFIDFIDDFGKRLLTYILEHNPKQRIITISGICEYSEKLGCDFCVENYNKSRVMKPINHEDIVQIFNGKEHNCELYASNKMMMELKKIEKTIKKEYSDFLFDEQTLTFSSKNLRHYNPDFFTIIEKLNESDIEYSVDEHANIKILG